MPKQVLVPEATHSTPLLFQNIMVYQITK